MPDEIIACITVGAAITSIVVQGLLLIAAWRLMEAHQELARAVVEMSIHMRRPAPPPAPPANPEAP